MNILIGTVLIGGAALWLLTILPNAEWRQAAGRATWETAKFTLPRIFVALLGAGFFAELLPEDRVRALFGAESGILSLVLAAALGPITPGGAFVSFAIGAAALKAGAAPLPVLVYVTSWTLFSLSRLLAYELPFMERDGTQLRVLVSLPLPLIVAILAGFVL